MTFPSKIALDGPAASGKTTVGELLARKLGYLLFDTGIMYRAATLAALQRGVDIDDEQTVTKLSEQLEIDVRPPTVDDGRLYTVLVDGQDVTFELRHPEVDAHVSTVSAYAGVRKAMTEQQRRIGERGRVVMVGRDIGTVVMPDADLKIYLDASPEERARRRLRDSRARGDEMPYEEVLANVLLRDRIDSGRKTAPLRKASDALVIDSTNMTVAEVLACIESEIRRLQQRKLERVHASDN